MEQSRQVGLGWEVSRVRWTPWRTLGESGDTLGSAGRNWERWERAGEALRGTGNVIGESGETLGESGVDWGNGREGGSLGLD